MNSSKRKLTNAELNILFSILPESKPAYALYRKKVENFFVIGTGRFGAQNLILGKYGDEPDHSLPSSPVFSYGEMEFKELKVEVVLHEESEEKIEIEIIRSGYNAELPDGKPEKVKTIADFSPLSAGSGWRPCRSLELNKGGFYLSFLIKLKKIILTDINTGYNALIPISNFYNELMFVKNIREPKIALKPGIFFDEHEKYSDTEMKAAFFRYNQLFKRADIKEDVTPASPAPKQGFFRKLFKGK